MVPACLAMACMLAGCAAFDRVSPTRPLTQPLTLPPAWSDAQSSASAGNASTPLALWWQRFDDALMVSLIDDALNANTSVRSARAALAQSRATADLQSAALWPTLGGSASAQRSRRGAGGDNASTSSLYTAGFDASWEPDVFGTLRAGVSAADADVVASAASLGDVQVSLAAEVALNYLQLRALQWRLAIAVQNLQSQEDTLQITQWRVQAGLLTELETEQARAATAQTRAQIPLLQSAATQTEHSLAVLTRRAPATLHDRLAAVRPALPAPPADLVLAFPADTLRQRPDVRAAQARVSAAADRVTQAEAARLPNFQLVGSLGLSAVSLATLTNGSSVLASVLASASASLLDGGAGRARVRIQQETLEGAAASYDAAVLAALKEVEDSLVALRQDRARLQSLAVAETSARNAAQLAGMRYRSGLIDFQVVLETQRTALTTQDAVAASSADVNADHVRLYKALGGGWEPSESGDGDRATPASGTAAEPR